MAWVISRKKCHFGGELSPETWRSLLTLYNDRHVSGLQAHTTQHNVWLVSPCCMALSAALCSEVHVPRPARISFERRFEWADSTLLELFTLKVFSSPLSPCAATVLPASACVCVWTRCDSSWLKRTWPALACLWLVYPAKPYPIWVVISKQTNHRGFSLWFFSALKNFISNV